MALVTETTETDNSATTVTANGSKLVVPWSGLSWANPFIDLVTFGPAPEAVTDVLAPGDLILIMPTAAGTWALAQVPQAQSAVCLARSTGWFDQQPDRRIGFCYE